jgi:ATP sulfurylase
MEATGADTRPQVSEGITACRWTTLDEARELIVYENARDVLHRAHEMLPATSRSALPGVRVRSG